jgi:hypothetical protein
MTYHIDQLGRVVQEVPETLGCTGCMYFVGRKTCADKEPLENQHRILCRHNNTIFKLVETT